MSGAAAFASGRTISSDGTRIGYRQAGSGSPVVVVHGVLADASSWTGVAEELCGNHSLLLMDRRNRGASGRGPHTLNSEVSDIRAVLAAAGPGTALAGHSFGGTLALEAALAASPGELAALVLYEPGGPALREQLDGKAIGSLRKAAAAGDRDAALRIAIEMIAGAGGVSRADAESSQAKSATVPEEWARLAELALLLPREIESVQVLRDWTLERYATISLPTLVVVGALSEDLQQRTCADLVAQLPKGRLVRLEGQGHLAHQEAPALLAGTIADFLAEVG